MSDWEVIRRQVAIGGNVRGGGRPIAGALVAATRKDAAGKAVQTRSRDDGSYFFLDLADASYEVLAMANAGKATGTAQVIRKQDGSVTMAWLDLDLVGQ